MEFLAEFLLPLFRQVRRTEHCHAPHLRTIEQFARLVAKMDAIPEGEGTLLDNMMFTLGSGLSSGALHVYTDLPIVIAGSGGRRIATNCHYQSSTGTPVANLWLAMAQVMGVQTDRIADSTGPLALA